MEALAVLFLGALLSLVIDVLKALWEVACFLGRFILELKKESEKEPGR